MKKDCIAMLLAGGEGKRLGCLTKHLAKPAVPFGGKYRIIDFALSNCTNSGIDTVGILTQYQAQQLHEYIAEGDIWGFNPKQGGAIKLPSLIEKNAGNCYEGTADAVYQNLCFIERYDPEQVLIISGDHIYKMDYMLMLAYHKKKNADVTIGVVKVPWEEASRFGTITADNKGRISCFEEKPQHPKSNLASMGIYIFNTKVLKEFLYRDKQNTASSHDFGKDVIPSMLQHQKKIYAYFFSGYWKDVGTPVSLWKANMDLLENNPLLDTNDDKWKIYSAANDLQLKYVAPSAKIQKSIISRGCCILGEIKNSVVFSEVWVGENSHIQDSIIMSNVKIGANVTITRSIIGNNAVINDGCHIGDAEESAEITVIDEKAVLYGKVAVKKQLLQSG